MGMGVYPNLSFGGYGYWVDTRDEITGFVGWVLGIYMY